LLAIAQYISKTLDNNQTIDEVKKQLSTENKSQNVTRGNRSGIISHKKKKLIIYK
jgi:hypothetical protein